MKSTIKKEHADLQMEDKNKSKSLFVNSKKFPIQKLKELICQNFKTNTSLSRTSIRSNHIITKINSN